MCGALIGVMIIYLYLKIIKLIINYIKNKDEEN